MEKISRKIISTSYNEEIASFFETIEYSFKRFNINKSIHEYGANYCKLNGKNTLNDFVNFLNGNKGRSIEEYYTYHNLKHLFKQVSEKTNVKIDIEHISGNNTYDFLITFNGIKILVEHKYIKQNGITDGGQDISNAVNDIKNEEIFNKVIFIIEHDENNVITDIHIEAFVTNIVVSRNNTFRLNKRSIHKTTGNVKGIWQVTTKPNITWLNGLETIYDIKLKLLEIYNNTNKISA